MTAAQVREIGVAADAFAEGPDDSPVFGNRYADLTTRQDIQLHWIRIADVPRIWQRFWEVGLTTVQACGDSARNVCSCPVSGIDAKEVVEALPVAQAISAFFTGNREYANLPRKFKIAVTGCTEDCARVEINDIGLWPAEQADGTRRLQRADRRRPLRRRAHGLRHRRLHPARPGGRALPGRRPALRRAGQPREPRPGPDALPGPGARARGVPGRPRRADQLRAASRPAGS